MLSAILEKIFYCKNYYNNEKKWKWINILGKKFKLRVKYSKNLRRFISTSKPAPLDYTDNTHREKVYISIVAIFKDEPDIIDWIEHHIKVGVERFYLYDNDSTEDYERILSDYIAAGTVVYRKISGVGRQRYVYRDAVYRFKDETEWIAIIDIDEYLVPVEKENLRTFLKDYDAFSGVVVNWVMYDSNGLQKRPKDKSVIEAYTRANKNPQFYRNLLVKSIVKPRDVRYVCSAHVCIYEKGKFAVDENFIGHENYVRTQTLKNSTNKIRINHYFCKSKEDYLTKIGKGCADRKGFIKFDEGLLNFKNGKHDYTAWRFFNR